MRYWLIGIVVVLFGVRAMSQEVPANAGEIAGIVTDIDGKPIEGALVDAWTWYAGNETKTGKDGKFRLKDLNGHRTVELRVSKAGFSPWYETHQPNGVSDLLVVLGNKTFLQGTVFAPDGHAVANALVRADCGPKVLEDQMHLTHVWTEAKSDADGHYKMMVSPDSYVVQTRVADTGVAELQVGVGADEGVKQDIHLDPGVRFVVKCVDFLTNEPVVGVKLTASDQKGMRATSDEKGEAVFEHMPEAVFDFDVAGRGYVKYWSADAVNADARDRPMNLSLRWSGVQFTVAGGGKPVTVQLEKGVAISGHVVDPDGKPVVGATIATAKTGWGDSIDMTQRFTTRSNKQGAFKIVLPASGDERFNLIAHDGDYNQWRTWANGVTQPMTTVAGQEKTDITIRLTRPATIKGRVVDAGGNAVSDKSVRVMSADDLDSRYLDPEARTDKDGNFTIQFVRQGDVFVQAEPFYMRMPGDNRMPAVASTPVTVAENEVKVDVTVTITK